MRNSSFSGSTLAEAGIDKKSCCAGAAQPHWDGQNLDFVAGHTLQWYTSDVE
jgi:hypothetical protein